MRKDNIMNKKLSIKEQEDKVKSIIAYKIKHCGTPLTQLAKQSKLSITTVRNLANEKIMPSIITLFKLSKGMGIKIAQLLYDETND